MSAQNNGTKKTPLFREAAANVQVKQRPVDLMKAMNITGKVTTA
jgi:hypothetical protein